MMRVGPSAGALLLTTSSLLRGRVRCGVRGMSMSVTASGSFELDLFSPAKVDLFLRVLGARDVNDGLHESASLLQAVTMGDRVRLARMPATPTTFAGVVRPSRVSEPIRQHCEFTVSPSHLDRAQTGAQPAPLALRALFVE